MTDPLNRWVREQLHDILGFVDHNTVNYVVALGICAVPVVN